MTTYRLVALAELTTGGPPRPRAKCFASDTFGTGAICNRLQNLSLSARWSPDANGQFCPFEENRTLTSDLEPEVATAVGEGCDVTNTMETTMTVINLLRPTEAQRSYVLDLLERMTPTERDQFMAFGRELIDAEPFDDDPRPAA